MTTKTVHLLRTLSFSALVFTVLLSAWACNKDQKDGNPTYTGETLYLSCFDRWGLKTSSDTDTLLLFIPDSPLPSPYEQEGVRVSFDASNVRPNTLQPTFPDPSIDPGTLFQAEVRNLVKLD